MPIPVGIGAAGLSAGASLAGSYLSGQQDRAMSGEAHDWAVEDEQNRRRWEEKMSNSAHQREVEDLRKAGLNPILSGTGGSGASTPAGGNPQIDRAKAPDYGKFASTAIDARLSSGSLRLMKAQEEAASSSADAAKAQARKTNKEADILGPKSFIYDKIEEGIRSGAEKIKSVHKDIKQRYENRPTMKERP